MSLSDNKGSESRPISGRELGTGFECESSAGKRTTPDSNQGKRLAPLSLRLSREERARLEQDAAGQALGAYIKDRLFADLPAQRAGRRLPVRDQRTIAQALAQLGRSELAASLRDLAAAARSGSLECDAEVRAALLAGCADILFIRQILVAALGLKPAAAPQSALATPRRAFPSVAAREAAR